MSNTTRNTTCDGDKSFARKLLSLNGYELQDAWLQRPMDEFERVETISEDMIGDSTNRHHRTIYQCNTDGKFYEYSYWEDYFGEESYHRFREVQKVPIAKYEWR